MELVLQEAMEFARQDRIDIPIARAELAQLGYGLRHLNVSDRMPRIDYR